MAYAGLAALKTTFGFEDGPYVAQTPHSGIVLGPYPIALFSRGVIKPADIYGVDDDSIVLSPARRWLEGYCRDSYTGWGTEADGGGLKVLVG